jgi:hypothetical protein
MFKDNKYYNGGKREVAGMVGVLALPGYFRYKGFRAEVNKDNLANL